MKLTSSIATVVVLILVAIGLFLLAGEREENAGHGGSSAEPQTSALFAENSAIFATDQPGGNTVTVSALVLESDGYVVVHEGAGTVPGAILGSSELLRAGGHENVGVKLSREVESGEALYAMLHADNGDGSFTANDDAPVIDSAGAIIMMVFRIDLNAELPAGVSL